MFYSSVKFDILFLSQDFKFDNHRCNSDKFDKLLAPLIKSDGILSTSAHYTIHSNLIALF